jgi:pyruvate,water dikinase
MTNPDWLPTLRRAAAVVTEGGGMTCHAAIVSRELGVPCVVGARAATTVLHDGQVVTVDGTTGAVVTEVRTPSVRAGHRLP